VKYDRNGGIVFSQIWLAPAPNRFGTRGPGKALTTPEDNCLSPSLSAAGDKIAMICTSGGQVARLVTAPFDGNTLGPPATVASGTLAAPAWAPDGNSLVYYQGVAPSGHFQLMWLNLAAPPTPAPTPKAGATPKPPTPVATPKPPVPKQVTTDNDFDATSSPVWF
jgi:Tol biopolymer transport system component